MALEKFKNIRFKPQSLSLIDDCAAVIDQYQQQNLRLTLRQLYYQLVSKNTIRNEEKSYKNLGSVVSDARLAGLLDWDAIEDRVRVPRPPPEWESIADLTASALRQYRLPRWKGQQNYVELWVEKDALAGVLRPIALEYHVTLMVNRGYSSQSAMYEAAKRFLEACGSPNDECHTCYGDKDCSTCAGTGKDGKKKCFDCEGRKVCQNCDGRGFDEYARKQYDRQPILLYLGDHDPSGEDMVRDVRDRLEMFGVRGIEVRKLALNMAQVKHYNPPPNPAKVTDSRAAEYIKKHGASSWEVDALPPNVLAQIIRNALDALVDATEMDKVKAQEALDKEQLTKAVASIMKKKKGT